MGLFDSIRKGWAAGGDAESREAKRAELDAAREQAKAKRAADWAEHKQRQAERVERLRGGQP